MNLIRLVFTSRSWNFVTIETSAKMCYFWELMFEQLLFYANTWQWNNRKGHGQNV